RQGRIGRRFGARQIAVVVLVQGIEARIVRRLVIARDLLLGLVQIFFGHRRQVFGAGEFPVAVLVGLLEVLRELRVLRGFGARQVPVMVLVQGVEARIVRRLVGKRVARSQRQRAGADQRWFRDSHVTSSASR